VSSVVRGSPAESAGIVAGDVLTGAGGKAMAGATAFRAVLGAAPQDTIVPLVITDRRGVSRGLTLPVGSMPLVVSPFDESLPFNVLIARLRSHLVTDEDPIARLNLAVSLMAVRSWDAAIAELSHVDLPAGPGVSQGTVTYLHAECLSRVGRTEEARRLWQSLAADAAHADSLLTADGPPIKELAVSRLAAGDSGSR
jgi:hypothetical protein